jgi:hypothetical protein
MDLTHTYYYEVGAFYNIHITYNNDNNNNHDNNVVAHEDINIDNRDNNKFYANHKYCYSQGSEMHVFQNMEDNSYLHLWTGLNLNIVPNVQM